jgi:CRP-like cAMP-binding protein/Fe-S-cluster-containing hydrogenase component 2
VLDTKELLAERVEAEAVACIGCHDCMLACPLVESQYVSIAELNEAVHQPQIHNPNVVSFVTACTQCRQCVPVCPADLSRADMVLFNKMKVEDTVPDQPMWLQAGHHIVPSSFTLDGLAASLTQIKLFAGVAQQDLRRMLLKVTLRRLAVGEVLCREGTFHERLYIVLEGGLEQSTQGPWGHVPILILPPGAFFGEMAIMADQPEPFTVAAMAPSVVIEIPKAAVVRTMDQSSAFQATMEELYRQRALWTYTRKPSLLGGLPEAAMTELMESAQLLPLSTDERLLREGEPPKDVYFVRSGFLRLSRRMGDSEIVATYLREGDLLGALPLVLGERENWFTARASCPSEVVRIPGALLLKLLGRYPQASHAIMSSSEEAEHVARAQAQLAFQTQTMMGTHQGQPGPAAPGGNQGSNATMMQPLTMGALVEAGLAQGSEVLVVDQNRCVHCRACIDACARRHGYSRLELRGLQLDNLLFPTACRHCEDPVCLLCSVNGIMRLPEGEITIVDDNCIGCGACAERCPYGNIRMHAATKPKRGLLQGIWRLLKGPDYEAVQDDVDTTQARVAVKCDLCAGYDNYACVVACPVGAAARIDPVDILGGGMIGAMAPRNR